MPTAALLVLLALAGGLAPARGAGTSAAPLMSAPIGARPLALGSSFVSIVDDPYALIYNPAGLGIVNRRQATSFFAKQLADQSLSAALLAWPLGRFGGLGLGIESQDYGRLEVFDGSGNIETRKAQQDLLLSAGYGYATAASWDGPGRLSAGATAKFYRSTIAEQARASAAALDLGALWESPWLVTAGASVANLGADVGYKGGAATGAKSPLPRTVRLGASLPLKSLSASVPLLATADFIKTAGESAAFGFGMEYAVIQPVAVRLGYRFSGDEDSALTAGIGLKLGSMRFDYGFAAATSALESQHYLSLGFEFGAPAPRRSYAEARRLRARELSQYPEALFQRGQLFWATEAAESEPSLPRAAETLAKIKDWVADVLRQGPMPDARRHAYAVAYRSRFGETSPAQTVADLETALAHDSGNEELAKELADARRAASAEAEKTRAESRQLYAKGLRKYESKRYAAAIQLLRRAVRLNAADEAAFKLLDLSIQAYAASQAATQASVQAAAAPKPKPKPAPLPEPSYDTGKAEQLYREGLSAYANEDLLKAIGLWEQSLRNNPYDQRCVNGLALARQNLKARDAKRK